MSATDALDWRELLFRRRLTGVRLSTEPTARVVDQLLPGMRAQPPFVVVQVVGTNGKGSTAAMIDHGLRRLGHGPVGLFTSPHLERIGERIRIDGCPVTDELIASGVVELARAEAAAGVALSFFEVLTAIALRCFVEAQCSHVILEAGIGGRVDSTSVLRPDVVAIARIALDHQTILGDTLTAIASEKAFVIRSGVAAYAMAQEPEARVVLDARAREQGTTVRFVEPLAESPRGLPGPHQRHNAALALAVLRGLDPRASAADLDDVVWPGRLERLPFEDTSGQLWLDVAHNTDGIVALCRALDELEIVPELIVFGTMSDKPAAQMAAHLRPRAPLWLVPPARTDAFDAAAHAQLGEPCFARTDDPALLDALRGRLRQGATILVCGSNYLVGALRSRLRDPRGALDGPEYGDPRVCSAPAAR